MSSDPSLVISDDQINGRVSPFKGRLMDEILDAEYKVVEHQIARPLDRSQHSWSFSRNTPKPSRRSGGR